MAPAVNSCFLRCPLPLSHPAGEGSHAAASTSSAGSEGSSVESPTASTVAVASQFGSHQINDTQSLSSDAPSEEKKNGSVTTTPGKDGGNTPVFFFNVSVKPTAIRGFFFICTVYKCMIILVQLLPLFPHPRTVKSDDRDTTVRDLATRLAAAGPRVHELYLKSLSQFFSTLQVGQKKRWLDRSYDTSKFEFCTVTLTQRYLAWQDWDVEVI